jgi:type II secretory ATPase GspE/PulE/Tfp pilus assembly ATPase PilB-like protein
VTAVRKKLRLGELLVDNRVISQQQLDAALAEHKKSGRQFGRNLVDSAFISEDARLSFLSQQLDPPFVELAHYRFEPAVVRLIPEIHARRFRAIALKDKGDCVQVGLSDATNIFAHDELSRIIGRPIEVAVVRAQELLDSLERVYQHTDRITGIAGQLSDELKEGDFSEGVRDLAALGMPPGVLRRFPSAIKRPHGMVIVTGPTGSGKTSTLYLALKLLNEPEVKILTLEDPVEYRLPRVNQMQVNTQVGLTFARVLAHDTAAESGHRAGR